MNTPASLFVVLYSAVATDLVANFKKRAEAMGGHAVPEYKIVSHCHHSLNLLMDAIRHTNRAYIFDNSGDNADGKHTWLAEITEGKTMELKMYQVPAWFKRAMLEKIG